MADIHTWQSSVDGAPADYSTAANQVWSALFNALQAFLAAGWTLAGSCDSAAGAMDGVDRLGDGTFDAADWVRAAWNAGHTWFVVESPGHDYWVCFDVANDQDPSSVTVFVFVSHMPFTVNATNATWRPTSALVQQVSGGDALNKNQVTDGTFALPFRFNFIWSDTGDILMWTHKQGSLTPYWAFGAFKLADLDPTLGDQYPWVAYTYGYNANNPFLLSRLGDYLQWAGRSGGGASVDLAPAYETSRDGFGLNTIQASGGQWRRRYLAQPIHLWVLSSGVQDYKGALPDIEWCSANAKAGLGDTSADPTRRAMWNVWLPGMAAAAPSF